MKIVDVLFKHNNEFKIYKIINFLAALVHLINGILSITLSSENGKNINFPIQRTFVGWDKLDCNSTLKSYSNTSFGFQEFIITPASTEEGFSVNLLGLIVSFHMLSFVFQMGVYFTDYSDSITERGINFLRFCEYSVSASIMLLCIAFISNIVLLPSLVGLFFMSFATMILGGIAEGLFDDYIVNSKNNIYRDENYFTLYLRSLGWAAHLSGWVTLTAAYGVIIFDNFVLSVDKSGVELPWFVPFIVIGIFCFYMVFGAIQLIQLCYKDPCMGTVCGPLCGEKWYNPLRRGADIYITSPQREGIFKGLNLNEFIELLYVFNSLTTKTILGWVIISNLLSDEQMSGGPLPTC